MQPERKVQIEEGGRVLGHLKADLVQRRDLPHDGWVAHRVEAAILSQDGNEILGCNRNEVCMQCPELFLQETCVLLLVLADRYVDYTFSFYDEGNLEAIELADHGLGITVLSILFQIEIAHVGPRLELEHVVVVCRDLLLFFEGAKVHDPPLGLLLELGLPFKHVVELFDVDVGWSFCLGQKGLSLALQLVFSLILSLVHFTSDGRKHGRWRLRLEVLLLPVVECLLLLVLLLALFDHRIIHKVDFTAIGQAHVPVIVGVSRTGVAWVRLRVLGGGELRHEQALTEGAHRPIWRFDDLSLRQLQIDLLETESLHLRDHRVECRENA